MTGSAFSGFPGSLIVRVMGQGEMKGVAERLQGEAKAQEDSKEPPLDLFLYPLSHCLEPLIQPVIHTLIIASPVLFAANDGAWGAGMRVPGRCLQLRRKVLLQKGL